MKLDHCDHSLARLQDDPTRTSEVAFCVLVQSQIGEVYTPFEALHEPPGPSENFHLVLLQFWRIQHLALLGYWMWRPQSLRNLTTLSGSDRLSFKSRGCCLLYIMSRLQNLKFGCPLSAPCWSFLNATRSNKQFTASVMHQLCFAASASPGRDLSVCSGQILTARLMFPLDSWFLSPFTYPPSSVGRSLRSIPSDNIFQGVKHSGNSL